MTPQEMVNALSIIGEIHEGDFHDGLNGYFGWSLFFENGDLVLKASFEDPEAPLLNNEAAWVLTRKGN